MRRGRCGKEKEWTDCVQRADIRAFGIAGDWKVTTLLKAKVWVETVTERVDGGSWPCGGKKRSTRLDIATRRERKRDWESSYRTRKRIILRSDTHIGLADESKKSLYGRETKRDLRSA